MIFLWCQRQRVMKAHGWFRDLCVFYYVGVQDTQQRRSWRGGSRQIVKWGIELQIILKPYPVWESQTERSPEIVHGFCLEFHRDCFDMSWDCFVPSLIPKARKKRQLGKYPQGRVICSLHQEAISETEQLQASQDNWKRPFWEGLGWPFAKDLIRWSRQHKMPLRKPEGMENLAFLEGGCCQVLFCPARQRNL